MCCNGKVYPYKNDVDFSIILFGTKQNARINVSSVYNTKKGQFVIKSM